jgi:hypothetical protein
VQVQSKGRQDRPYPMRAHSVAMRPDLSRK